MKKILWVLINCNTVKEADKIGTALLKRRLSACYDIVPRLKTAYFWPPKSGKIASAKGAILIAETLPGYFQKIYKVAKGLHSDKMPFVGSLVIEVRNEYYQWVRGEVH